MKRFIQLTKGIAYVIMFLIPSLIILHFKIAGLLFLHGRAFCEDKIHDIFLQHYKCKRFLYFLLYNSRVYFESDIQIPSDQPYLILCNHKGASDFFLCLHLFSEIAIRFIVKKSLRGTNSFAQIPGYSLGFSLMNSCMIDRSAKFATVKQIQDYTKIYHSKNQSIFLFPEGTRHKASMTKPFISSAIKIILRKKNIPILLVAASNGHKIDSFLKVQSNVTLRIKILKIINIQDTRNIASDIENFRSLIDTQLLQWEKIDGS